MQIIINPLSRLKIRTHCIIKAPVCIHVSFLRFTSMLLCVALFVSIAVSLVTLGAHAKKFRRSEMYRNCCSGLSNSGFSMSSRSKIGDLAAQAWIKEDIPLANAMANWLGNYDKIYSLHASPHERFLPNADTGYPQLPLASIRDIQWIFIVLTNTVCLTILCISMAPRSCFLLHWVNVPFSMNGDTRDSSNFPWYTPKRGRMKRCERDRHAMACRKTSLWRESLPMYQHRQTKLPLHSRNDYSGTPFSALRVSLHIFLWKHVQNLPCRSHQDAPHLRRW